jgi:hypothetical protein
MGAILRHRGADWGGCSETWGAGLTRFLLEAGEDVREYRLGWPTNRGSSLSSLKDLAEQPKPPSPSG